MRIARLWLISVCALGLLAATSGAAHAAGAVKIDGTRFTMEVPQGWNPGYKDLDNLFMIFFKDPASGAVLEGVYLRGAQPADFTLAKFKQARIDSENKRYEGKGHKVVKEGEISIGGAKGNYLETTWKDGGKDMVKYTAQHLKDGQRYLVVMSGEKGKVDKKVFDHAVATFALVAAK